MEHKKALAALLSAVLVLLACVSCGPAEQTKETLAEHDGHIYSEVADHLDRRSWRRTPAMSAASSGWTAICARCAA